MFTRLTVLARWILLVVLVVPVVAGLIGVVFPALGYFPVLGATTFSFDVFKQLLSVDDLGRMVWLSLFTGLGATLLSIAGAIFLLAACYQTKTFRYLQGLLSPLLALPHAATAIAFLFVISPSGIITRLFTASGEGVMVSAGMSKWSFAFPYDEIGLSVLFALTLKELPFVVLMAMSVMSQPQLSNKFKGYVAIGASLGYTPIASFMKLVLPLVYRQIRLPLLAVVVFATSNVEIPLILGPNNPSTLSVAVFYWFNHIDLQMRLLGSAAAILQVGVSCLALLMFIVVEKIASKVASSQRIQGTRTFFDFFIMIKAAGIIGLYVVLCGLVVYSVIMHSVAQYWVFPALYPSGLTLLHWQTVLGGMLAPIVNTLLLGVAVSVSSVIIVLLALESELLKPAKSTMALVLSLALFLPLLVPGVAFLYGLVWLQQIVLASATWFHTFIAHLVYVLPYVFMALAVAYRKFDTRYAMVAQSLGRTPWQVFTHVKLPLLASPILVAWALGASISFSQYLPTLLASGGTLPTITTEAVASASGNSSRVTAVYLIIQAILPLVAFIVAWWAPTLLVNRKRGENGVLRSVSKESEVLNGK